MKHPIIASIIGVPCLVAEGAYFGLELQLVALSVFAFVSLCFTLAFVMGIIE